MSVERNVKPARERIGLHIAIAFVVALLLYIVGFFLIERARNVKGGWRVTFQSDENARPAVTVLQPVLQISNVTFVFPENRIDRTNFSQTIVFDSPITNVPFGKVIFFDTTFLPGTLTFDFFGNEIEFLPRTLVVNRKEVPWQSNMKLELESRK